MEQSVVASSGVGGVLVAGRQGRADISESHIVENSHYGILLYDGAQLSLSGCLVIENGDNSIVYGDGTSVTQHLPNTIDPAMYLQPLGIGVRRHAE
jgi:hypothetical protein